MADIARAMQTPPPAQEQARAPAGPDPRFMPAPPPADNAARDAKNKRDQARRTAKRAADAKAKLAATKKAAAPKRKKKKVAAVRKARAQADAIMALTKKKRRGRPPGAKNKPKVSLDQAIDAAFTQALPPQATSARRPATVGMGTDPFSVFLTVRDVLARLLPAQRVQVLAALVNEK